MKVEKDHFYQSQMMVILGLMEHTKDNLHGTVFEDDEDLKNILSILLQGSNLAVARMTKIMDEYEEDDRDCCYCR